MKPNQTELPRVPQVVRDILPEPGVVVARCTVPTCGAVTPLDLGPGLYRLLARRSLWRLETQLRCTCGARRGALEAWPANLAILPGRERLFLFLV